MNDQLLKRNDCREHHAIFFRTPKRITITVPFGAYQKLLERSNEEGRSLSNLAAFLLETSLEA